MHEPFLVPMPKVIAHRGDSANYPENTLPAFLSAVKMNIDVIETDVHLSKDGVLVIWHDPTLDRNTNGSGRIEDHTLPQLKTYDAGYTFTKDGGRTFPFRGKGITLCTLDEALKACPDQRFNVDLKTKDLAIVDEFLAVVQTNQAEARVLGASFHLSNLRELRRKEPKILTSLTTVEVLSYLILQKLHILPRTLGKGRRIIFQVPVSQGILKIVTKEFVTQMHKRNAVIQVWTINTRKEMEELFALGVDSIMTDKPALVIEVAEKSGLRNK
ncbi:glycerophosphodiester phosphodiesterase [uncultured Sphaerochaeta sp.]|uniref:glycerophosphodiester phosphodiesterase n=1 Tax=uncultured Sphaerochaeta sp. TaxID=886478 RepID=UPI002A0A252C|nr:glycerophosphodiester phosphodiesterase [uncultured Sphaerochaeta sp.]